MPLRELFYRLIGRAQPYRARDFRRRERLRIDYQILASMLLDHLDFESVLDVGCANGFLLTEFQAAGKRVAGIEAAESVRRVLPPELRELVSIGDFSETSGEWDLVCCVEVAEHIEPARSVELVDAITAVARRWVYFTAAPPGQGGCGHINCRPHAEWLQWFEQRGFQVDESRTEALHVRMPALRIAHWLRGNGYILHRVGNGGGS